MKPLYLAPLAMAASVGWAAPASAQIDKGCYKYWGASIATAKSVDKLRADIDCFVRAKAKADDSIASRAKRIAQLTAPTPKPVPAPAPVIVGDAIEPELGLDFTKVPASIATKEDVASLIGWAQDYTGGAKGAIAPSARPDVVGAFRFMCNAGQVSYDDPLVFPKQPGKSHLHQWFGNTAANASSDYASLRTTGDSTCMNILNRSAYWMPAMLDGKGHVVRPDYVSIYYKRLPKDSPDCRKQGKECVALPRGLRYIMGYDMVSDTQPTGAFYFNCDGPTATPGHYPLITAVAPLCGPGNRLGAVISSPSCWDGKHLDSANHRSHVSYPSYGDWGYLKCDDAHPYVIPTFTMGAWYDTGDIPIGAAGSVATWSLSSDSMNMGGKMTQMPAGSTFHADWFGAWDEEVMAIWMDNCINKLLSCSGGDLGNGHQLREVNRILWKAEPRLIDIPARPS